MFEKPAALFNESMTYAQSKSIQQQSINVLQKSNMDFKLSIVSLPVAFGKENSNPILPPQLK